MMMMLKVDLNAPTLGGVAPSQDSNKPESTSVDPLATPDQDRATLSTDKARIDGLTNQAIALSAIRQERVNALRQAIQSGDYRIESGKTADALIQDAS